ncbi:12757_t:CDS:1, partial [Ambispora leptoticha]
MSKREPSNKMKLGPCIKKYFSLSSTQRWDYDSFHLFMRILGYEDDTIIFRNYIRQLNDIIKDNNTDTEKKFIATRYKN